MPCAPATASAAAHDRELDDSPGSNLTTPTSQGWAVGLGGAVRGAWDLVTGVAKVAKGFKQMHYATVNPARPTVVPKATRGARVGHRAGNSNGHWQARVTDRWDPALDGSGLLPTQLRVKDLIQPAVKRFVFQQWCRASVVYQPLWRGTDRINVGHVRRGR